MHPGLYGGCLPGGRYVLRAWYYFRLIAGPTANIYGSFFDDSYLVPSKTWYCKCAAGGRNYCGGNVFLHSSRVQEKRLAVILTQEFSDEGAHLSVCVAHICCRYRVAGRKLCPDYRDGTNDGPGHLDVNCTDDHDQEEEVLKI